MDTGDTVKQYPDPMEERTVFISNLPDDVTEDDLKAKFVEVWSCNVIVWPHEVEPCFYS